MSMLNDLIGKRFGRITALSPDRYVKGLGTYWFCRCDCGKQFKVQRSNLVMGGTTSCGCVFKDGRPRPNRGRKPASDIPAKDLSVPSPVGTRKKLRLHSGPVGDNKYQPSIDPDSALWLRIARTA